MKSTIIRYIGDEYLDTKSVIYGALATIVMVLALLYPDSYVGARRENTLRGPKPLPLLGNTVEIVLNSKEMLTWFTKCQNRYGEAFTFSMPSWGRVIVINMPQWLEAMRKGDNVRYGKGEAALSVFREFPGYSAFGTEGKTWRLTRKIQMPVYQLKASNDHVTQSLATILPIVKELFNALSKANAVIDWNDFGGRLALDLFCRSALSLDADILTADPECLQKQVALMDSVAALNRVSGSRLYNPFWRITEHFNGNHRLFRGARKQVYSMIGHITNQRIKSSAGDSQKLGSDFLGSLLRSPEAHDEKLVRDTLMTLLFAGRDNVQNALAWSLSELHRFPSWIHRLREEAIHLNPSDAVVPYDELSSYHIHLAVIHETLRLWPGVPKNARLVLKDDVLPAIPEFGMKEIHIKEGDYVIWSDFDMMKNEKVWGPDAKIFNPGRHLDEHGHFCRPVFPRFHTFGGGPRLCPGAQLAIYELVAILSSLLRDFDITPAGAEEMVYIDAFTMSMKGPFPVQIKLR